MAHELHHLAAAGLSVTPRTSALILALALVACSGEPEPADPAGSSSASGGGGGSSDAGAGGGDGSSEGCPPGAMMRQKAAVPSDPASGCVDTDSPLAIPACTGPEIYELVTYTCLRRVSDGKEFWMAHNAVVRPASSEWQLCGHEPHPDDLSPEWPRPPAPCVTRCGGSQQTAPTVLTPAPISTCSPEDMRSMFRCGAANSERDEGCCRRPFCEKDDDCGDGASCTRVDPVGFIYSWVGVAPDGSFSCNWAGALGGAPEMLCVRNDP
ncbi:hypothetical protein [Sorangium sp. So ce513]|uniref:hypothetical protein n=1 Tax=Sorangium sp. So ce513 TaxID=3133315 RepID=UPI003F624C75